MTQVVEAADGRRLSVQSLGAPDGTPVFLLHGTPGSRTGPRPRGIILYRLGIRLISYDRPGYGGSDRQSGRAVADAAGDVAAIADALGIEERFSVVGRSGGGPHALACAAVLSDRVNSAAALSSLAPVNAEGLDWYDGMTRSNVSDYKDAEAILAVALAERAGRVRDDPDSLLRHLEPELANGDRKVVEDIAIWRIIAENHAEALRDSASGWIDDVLALRSPWGFDPAAIKVPVLLWHGDADTFSPVSHTHWLATRIPESVVKLQSDAAHFGAVEILPAVLAWISLGEGRNAEFSQPGSPAGTDGFPVPGSRLRTAAGR